MVWGAEKTRIQKDRIELRNTLKGVEGVIL